MVLLDITLASKIGVLKEYANDPHRVFFCFTINNTMYIFILLMEFDIYMDHTKLQYENQHTKRKPQWHEFSCYS